MKTTLFTLMLCASVILTNAQQEVIPLYSHVVPNSKPTPTSYIEKNDNQWVTYVSVPTITPYFPQKNIANGTAIIIFPGGGYSGLAMDKEGYNIAKAFTTIGVTAFVVKYRLPSDETMLDKTIGPLQDAQQAILQVRKNAKEWGIKTNKIGVIGFSAGGHLASMEGTQFDTPLIENIDNISLRPDFMVLLYPVISFGPLTHVGSRESLIGKSPSAKQIEKYSSDKQVTQNTPPTLLINAADDGVVPVQNTIMFFEALQAANVKAELHIFQAGGHGFGLNNSKSKEKWFDWCKNWMNENGF